MASYLPQDLCITVPLSGMLIPLAAESSRREEAVEQQRLPTQIMYWQDFAQAPQQSSFLVRLKSTWRGVPPPLSFLLVTSLGSILPRNFRNPPPLFLSETPSIFSTRHGRLPGAEFQANPSPTPGYSSHFLPPRAHFGFCFPPCCHRGLLCSPHIPVSTYYVPDREYNSNMTRPLPLHYKS